jgi:hypothetical protein
VTLWRWVRFPYVRPAVPTADSITAVAQISRASGKFPTSTLLPVPGRKRWVTAKPDSCRCKSCLRCRWSGSVRSNESHDRRGSSTVEHPKNTHLHALPVPGRRRRVTVSRKVAGASPASGTRCGPESSGYRAHTMDVAQRRESAAGGPEGSPAEVRAQTPPFTGGRPLPAPFSRPEKTVKKKKRERVFRAP